MANNRTKKQASPPVPQNKQKTADVQRRFSVSRKLALLLAAVSFIVYSNTLKNGFAVDDSVMIVHNSIVSKGITAIPELLSTPHQRGFHKISNDEYRPLSLVLFCIEYQFVEKNPTPYHFMNILLFAGCVVLLFRFLDKLFDGKKTAVAFIASLLFALHPIHTEVVANVKSGDELLSFFFAFLSLNIFMKYIGSGSIAQLLTGSLCFLLSLLSKETAFTFIAIIPVIFFLFRNENRKRSVYISACAVLVTLIFLTIRFSVLNYYHANNITNINIIENALANTALSFESKIATAILMLGYYLKLLFVPYPLICDYSYITVPYTHFSDPLVLISLAVYIFLTVLCVKRFIANQKDPYALGIAFFLITIALFANIFFLIKSTMSERFMFYPSVGFCLVVALLIDRWFGKAGETGMRMLRQTKVLSIILPLCIVYAILTTDRNKAWADNYTLYKTDIGKAPNNSRLNYLLGYELFTMPAQEINPATQKQAIDDAIFYFRKALAVDTDYYFAAADLGAAYFDLGQYDSAEVYDKIALKLLPNSVIPWNNLSGVYLRAKKYHEDVGLGLQSIKISPNNVYAYADIGESYFHLGKYDSANLYLNMGISIDPNFFGSYAVHANVCRAMGNIDSARIYESMAQKVNEESR